MMKMRTTLAICLSLLIFPLPVAAQEFTVLAGYDKAIEWLESINWWGEGLHKEQLQTPRTLLIGISPPVAGVGATDARGHEEGIFLP